MSTDQQDLFAETIDLESLQYSRDQVCLLVSEMSHGLSRDRIADDMTGMGCPTTKAMIDAWASPKRSGHNLPFYLAAPFGAACRSTLLADWHVSLHSGVAFYGEEALRREIAAEIAELERHRAEFTRQINSLRKKIGV